MDTSRYQNGLIYKLCSKDPTIKDCYVGSTCNFTKRKYQHKSNCNNETCCKYNYYVYQFIRDHGGWENWDMIELIKYSCNTKRELELKEREHLELLGGTLNKQIPTRSKEEKNKTYYENNREKHRAVCNAWCEKNKERRKETNRLHREANKEQYAQNAKIWYEANKEQKLKKAKEKYTCECGSTLRKSDKNQHSKSLKHQKFLNEIKE